MNANLNMALPFISFKAQMPPVGLKSESVKLIDALKNVQQCNPGGLLETDIFIKEVSKNSNLASKKVERFLAKGTSAIVFLTPDDNILKLTLGNHYPNNRPHENFDVPVFEKGKSGKIYYYLEEKLYQHGLSENFVKQIKDNIRSSGYRPFDIYDEDVNQIGLSKTGKLYLLDPECARYKSIFHVLLAKVKNFYKKLSI